MTLQEKYQKQAVPALIKEFKIKNSLKLPRLDKIVVNVGLGEALKNKKALETMGVQLGFITGQKPAITRAKRSISTFKLRAGMPIGLKVTLRRKKMYEFLQRLISIVLPRLRDFRGVSAKSFDGKGNLSIGFSEITVFPEVKYEDLDKVRGMELTIITTAEDDKQAKFLLEKLGMPFTKSKVQN